MEGTSDFSEEDALPTRSGESPTHTGIGSSPSADTFSPNLPEARTAVSSRVARGESVTSPCEEDEEEEEDNDDDVDENETSSTSLSETSGRKLMGRKKSSLRFITQRKKRNATFRKRKRGLMKKGFELSKLTSAEVLVMVAWDDGVFSYGTKKLRRLLTAPLGKEMVRCCLNAPLPETAETTDTDEDVWTGECIEKIVLSPDMQNNRNGPTPPLSTLTASSQATDPVFRHPPSGALRDAMAAAGKTPPAHPALYGASPHMFRPDLASRADLYRAAQLQGNPNVNMASSMPPTTRPDARNTFSPCHAIPQAPSPQIPVMKQEQGVAPLAPKQSMQQPGLSPFVPEFQAPLNMSPGASKDLMAHQINQYLAAEGRAGYLRSMQQAPDLGLMSDLPGFAGAASVVAPGNGHGSIASRGSSSSCSSTGSVVASADLTQSAFLSMQSRSGVVSGACPDDFYQRADAIPPLPNWYNSCDPGNWNPSPTFL
ncbi:uncharacterized protein LOC135824898 isoform X1 [Sycon ciliatum]|uniref:uncharacterized protein LOC135824898 isoform X1 n=1 Tax=Sycon ciliatum TaxID=27933 RepID=UPI0020AC023D|eukprot:scpid68627/ scgid29416/ Serum response factor